MNSPSASPDQRAPKPHMITVVLSGLPIVVSTAALLTSLASYRYAKQTYELNAATNSAAVDVASLELRDDWQFSAKEPKPLPLRYTLQNLGKLPTKQVSVHLTFNAAVYSTEKNPTTGKPLTIIAGDWTLPVFHLENLPPGASHTFDLDIPNEKIRTLVMGIPQFDGDFFGINIISDINYSDAYGGEQKAVRCFYRHADANTSANRFQRGAIPACNTVSSGTSVIRWDQPPGK